MAVNKSVSILLFSFICVVVKSWNLESYGITKDYYVSSIAIYRTRAFLALPRSVCYNNESDPTLVEVPWTGEYRIPGIVLRKKLFSFDQQKWGICEEIQDAISLEIEPKRHNLWILDKGNEFCEPKILTFNLFQNAFSQSCELTSVPRNRLNIFVIDDHSLSENHHDVRAYIGEAGDNTILAFSLRDLKWWRLQMMEPTNLMGMFIKSEFMAISENEPVIFLSGRNTTRLYSVDLEELRNSESPLAIDAQNVVYKINATFVGDQLGFSSGLVTDASNGLIYYLVKDFAVVRWTIGNPVVAEYHDVLAQSYEDLPYVSQLFADPQKGIWALINPRDPEDCKNFTKLEESAPDLTERAVKLLKYNKNILK